MADSALRMVLLLAEIPEYPTQISVAELLERGRRIAPCFAVSRRTIERDLRVLSEHFPIRFDAQAKPGGWSFEKGTRFVMPAMTDGEAVTLVMAEQMLSALLPPGVRSEITSLVRAAQSKLHLGGKRKAAAWPDKIQILRNVPKRIAPQVEHEILNTLYSAVFDEVQVEVRYKRLGATEPRAYSLNPLALVLRDPVIYLICTRSDRDDVMHWPLHRFSHARRTVRKAHAPPGFDRQQRLDEGLMDYPVSGGEIRLRLRFPDETVGRFLLETPLSADQTDASVGGELFLCATVRDTLELRWWLLAFGARVEVQGPHALRREIAAAVTDAAGHYRS